MRAALVMATLRSKSGDDAFLSGTMAGSRPWVVPSLGSAMGMVWENGLSTAQGGMRLEFWYCLRFGA